MAIISNKDSVVDVDRYDHWLVILPLDVDTWVNLQRLESVGT